MLFQWTPYLRTIRPGQYVLFLGMWKRVVKAFPRQAGIILWLEDVTQVKSFNRDDDPYRKREGGLLESNKTALGVDAWAKTAGIEGWV